MTESDQSSKLEQEVSPVDALEMLLRVGNNQHPIIDIRNQRSMIVMDNVMHYLMEKGLVQDYHMQADTMDYATYATLTQKGREIYERIKQDAPDVFKGEPFFIVNPPPVTPDPFAYHYDLEPIEEEGEELEVRHDTYFGRTQEEWERAQARIERMTEVDNAIRSMIEGAYTLFHAHPELNPKSVLEKYREDFENIAKKISQEK